MFERGKWSPWAWIVIAIVVIAFAILLIGFARSARETSIRIRQDTPEIVRDTAADTIGAPAPRPDTAHQPANP